MDAEYARLLKSWEDEQQAYHQWLLKADNAAVDYEDQCKKRKAVVKAAWDAAEKRGVDLQPKAK